MDEVRLQEHEAKLAALTDYRDPKAANSHLGSTRAERL